MPPTAPTVPTQKPFTFYCELPWNLHREFTAEVNPDYAHRWWRMPCVVPALRLGLPWMNGLGINYVAEEVVRMLKHWKASTGISSLRWSLIIGNIGGDHEQNGATFDHQFPLLHNPLDKVPGAEFTPWAYHGIRQNREWLLQFAGCLQASLIDNRFPAPELLIINTEKGPGDLPMQYRNGAPVWAELAARDFRSCAADHAIGGNAATFRTLLEDKLPESLGGSWPAINTSLHGWPPARNPANFIACERFEGIRRRVWDHARVEGIQKPWQYVFTTCPVVEYGAAADSARAKVPFIPNGPGLFGMRGDFNTAWQGPQWYGELGVHDEDAADRDLSRMPVPGGLKWPTKTNWMEAFEGGWRSAGCKAGSGFDLREFAALSKAIATMRAHKQAAPKSPVCPWTTFTHGITDNQMRAFLGAMVEQQISQVAIWEQGHHWNTAKCDRWTETANALCLFEV